MTDVQVVPLGTKEFAVQVTEGGVETSHRVQVPGAFLDQLGLPGVDEALLVRETFAFLLEREPATSIMANFALPVVSEYFPEFLDDLRSRLAEEP